MRRATILVVLAAWLFAASPASAALPPFELVQKSLAQARGKKKSVVLDLRVTETGSTLTEWNLRGVYAMGDVPKRLGPDATLPLRLLRIATLSPDPVADLQKTYGFVNSKIATVGVQDGFVYVYGAVPAVSVYRDLQRLAAFSINVDGNRWVARLAWDEDKLTGLMITRDGKTVLTARQKPRP